MSRPLKQKELKAVRMNISLPHPLKAALMERCQRLNMIPSEYLAQLARQDIARGGDFVVKEEDKR
jgi:hypothetical protein